VYIHGKWASVQTKNTQLMLVAPDFVMRKVLGYPKPLPPREIAPSKAPSAAPTPAPAASSPAAAPPANPK